MKTTIQIICGYCQKDMGIKDGMGQTGISHSCCPECFKIEIKKAEQMAIEMNELERLSA